MIPATPPSAPVELRPGGKSALPSEQSLRAAGWQKKGRRPGAPGRCFVGAAFRAAAAATARLAAPAAAGGAARRASSGGATVKFPISVCAMTTGTASRITVIVLRSPEYPASASRLCSCTALEFHDPSGAAPGACPVFGVCAKLTPPERWVKFRSPPGVPRGTCRTGTPRSSVPAW